MLPGPLKRLPKQDDDAIWRNLARWDRAVEGNRPWATIAKRCTEYVEGNQWSESDRQLLASEGRPCLTFNKLGRLVRLVQGISRQNRYDLKFKPDGDASSSQSTAEALTKVAKQVHTSNKMRWREAECFRDGIVTGRGFLDVRIDYERNILGEIAVEAADPHTVYPDPHALAYEPAKWGFVFRSFWLSLNDMSLFMGKKTQAKLESLGLINGNSLPMTTSLQADDDQVPDRFFGLYGQDGPGEEFTVGEQHFALGDHLDKARRIIRTLEQQHYVACERQHFVDVETGDMQVIPDDMTEERIRFMLQWAAEHGNPLQVIKRMTKRVRWTVTAGNVLLWDAWSPYRSFTIVPFFASFRRGKTRGMVEDLLDPQDEINKRRSGEIHIMQTTANSGWLIHKRALDEEGKDQLETEGARPGINLYWDGQPFMKPERIQPGTPPTQMEKLEQKANADMLEISGINDSALGQLDRVQSGRAIEARQRQSVLGQEEAFDNMSLSRVLLGEKYLELIQDFYTEQRLIRILGDDEQPDDAIMINQRADAVGAIINDVTVGKYQVTIDEVPISATFREAQFQEAISIAQAGLPMPPEVLVDLSSMPRKDQIKAAIKQQQALVAAGLAPPPGKAGSAPKPGGGEGGMQGGGNVVPMRPGAGGAPKPGGM